MLGYPEVKWPPGCHGRRQAEAMAGGTEMNFFTPKPKIAEQKRRDYLKEE